MTPKTTLTARVTPDTRATLDRMATSGHTTTSELAGRVLTEWVAAQAAQQNTWREVHELLERANDIVVRVGNRDENPVQLHVAMQYLIRAISAINDAGTAPDSQPAA